MSPFRLKEFLALSEIGQIGRNLKSERPEVQTLQRQKSPLNRILGGPDRITGGTDSTAPQEPIGSIQE